jgi:hypothetical protein
VFDVIAAIEILRRQQLSILLGDVAIHTVDGMPSGRVIVDHDREPNRDLEGL